MIPGQGPVTPRGDHKDAIWKDISRRIDNKRTVQLAIFFIRSTTQRVASRSCPVVVGARFTCLEAHVAGFAGRNLEGIVLLAWTRMHSVHYQFDGKQVVEADTNLRVCANSYQRSRNLPRFSPFCECKNLYAGSTSSGNHSPSRASSSIVSMPLARTPAGT
jgi:hypothetical protein